MKKLLLLLAFLTLIMSSNALAQTYTYTYKYICSIDEDGDEVDAPLLKSGVTFKFRLTDNGSWCYHLDSDGNYTSEVGFGKFGYVGKEDDMLKYTERRTGIFADVNEADVLYFSTDYSTLYWQCFLEHGTSIRYLEYVE